MSRPLRDPEVKWRVDGEDGQIVVLFKEGMPLPVILNPTAARIFLLADGTRTVKDIAWCLCREFLHSRQDDAAVENDVREQVEYFVNNGIFKPE